MKADHVYRSVVALFAFAVICSAMSASRWFAASAFPIWAACCPTMRMQAGGELPAWLSIFTYGAGLVMLLFGVSLLLSRLWKTRRFISSVRGAAVAVPPVRLAGLIGALGPSRHVSVLATDIPLAFCSGIIRPEIGISTGLAELLNDRELTAVLLHEDHHRRRYDPLRGLLAEVMAAMLFFLPVAAELRDLFFTATEVEADRHAVRLVGRPSLAGALHKIVTHPLAVNLSVPGIAGLSATEVRIAQLLGDRPVAVGLSARSMLKSSVIIMLVCMLMF